MIARVAKDFLVLPEPSILSTAARAAHPTGLHGCGGVYKV